MNNIKFFNEDCFETMNKMQKYNEKVDLILTSPPYGTNIKAGKTRTLNNTKVKQNKYPYARYDIFVDNFEKWGGVFFLDNKII